jgi:hypothetical protein
MFFFHQPVVDTGTATFLLVGLPRNGTAMDCRQDFSIDVFAIDSNWVLLGRWVNLDPCFKKETLFKCI